MRCPRCGDPDTRVTDSRDSAGEIRRRRECAKCQVRFTTYERLQPDALQVVKRDGRREEFSAEKLLKSLRVACVKRPVPSGALEKLVNDIEAELHRLGKSEAPASIIGGAALGRLRTLDAVAAVRYASVYKNFEDVSGFINEIQDLQNGDDADASGSNQLELIPNEFQMPARRRSRRGRRPSITVPSAS